MRLSSKEFFERIIIVSAQLSVNLNSFPLEGRLGRVFFIIYHFSFINQRSLTERLLSA